MLEKMFTVNCDQFNWNNSSWTNPAYFCEEQIKLVSEYVSVRAEKAAEYSKKVKELQEE